MSSNSNLQIRTSSKIIDWIAVSVSATLFLIAVVPWVRVHLFSVNLWFDESGQYWLALGLHHFATPLSVPGGWSKIVEYGRVFNSDPGTYTLLLRAWINLFGSSIATLRSLSLLFFCLSPVVIVLAGRRLGGPVASYALAALAPLGSFMFFHYATEIRAYSMEGLAVLFFFFLPTWTDREGGIGRLLFLGAIGALLVGSRYSAYLYGAAACIVVCLPLRPFKGMIIRSLTISLPIAVMVAAGFLIFGRYQAGGAQKAPAYVEAFLLQGKDIAAIVAQIRQNFFEPEALPITIFLIVAPLVIFFGPASLERLKTFLGRAVLFVVLSVMFVAVASWTGKLPWAVHTRWSIGYQALSVACLASLIIMIGTLIRELLSERIGKFIGISLCVMALSGWAWWINIVQKQPRPYYETVGSLLSVIAERRDSRSLRFWVTEHANTSVRYLCEAGPLKERFLYPSNFHFETAQESSNRTPIPAGEYDIIVLNDQSVLPGYIERVVLSQVDWLEIMNTPPPSAVIVIKRD